MKECIICGKPNSEEHHMIFRGECKPLEHCKKNIVYLCHYHHRGTYGPHGTHGDKLDKQLKLKFQNWLEISFLKDSFTLEEIQEILGISYIAVKKLSKHMWIVKGKYTREDVIKACMGGVMILENEVEVME